MHAEDHVPRQKGVFAPLWRFVVKSADWGVEVRGIERVSEDNRTHTRIIDNFTMWLSVNMAITIFGLGVLGPAVFGLGLKEALATIIVFNNVSTSNRIPTAPAVIIVAGLTLIPCFFGYKFIHKYDRYSGILPGVIFIILLALGIRNFEVTPYAGSGAVEAAKVLSFGATLVGSCFGWASFVSVPPQALVSNSNWLTLSGSKGADWSVNQPVNTPGWKIFLYVWCGQNAGHLFTEGLGAAYGAALASHPDWANAYATGDIGGLLRIAFSPAKGFGQFLQVLLCLQIVAGNTPNIYSFCMTFQTLGPWFQAIPRAVIVIIMTILYAVLAGVGADTFSSTLTNLIIFLGYWLSNFCIILCLEHFVIRKGKWSNYELDEFQNWRRLPLGAAAFGAVCMGWVGATMGMSSSFFVGPIAKKIGGSGDIGWEMAMLLGGLTYLPLRIIEKKYWGY
ncbi:Purine-cytosine permease fcy21 [Cystobasidiomycetes sp. EMM_F5]